MTGNPRKIRASARRRHPTRSSYGTLEQEDDSAGLDLAYAADGLSLSLIDDFLSNYQRRCRGYIGRRRHTWCFPMFVLVSIPLEAQES